MVEHDFYKLMQIPPYTNVEVVKKRYHELAILYHPDKNPKNKGAEEYFKILTQGYNILGDADKKAVYDDLLKHYYTKKPTNPKDASSKKDLSERLFQNRERKRKDIIEDYLNEENTLSHRNRFIISILITLSGFLLTYNHWFINYLKLDTIYNFAGFMICYLGCYLIANNIYRKDAYKNAIRIENNRVDKRAINVFLSLFFLLPIVFLSLVNLSAKIQLNYFSDYTTVQSITNKNNEVLYEYTVNKERIMRTSNLLIDASTFQYRQIRVKYSRLNPNISELILLE